MMNELGLYDIYGLSHVPFWQTSRFFWAVVLLLSVLVGLLIIGLVRWYRGAKKRHNIPYWQNALIEISALKASNCTTVEQSAQLYVRLTRVLKRYLSERYQLALEGRTDTEVIAIVSTTPQLDPVLLPIIQAIFAGGEYIKFAHVHAAQDQMEKDIQNSILFIEQTRPRIEKT